MGGIHESLLYCFFNADLAMLFSLACNFSHSWNVIAHYTQYSQRFYILQCLKKVIFGSVFPWTYIWGNTLNTLYQNFNLWSHLWVWMSCQYGVSKFKTHLLNTGCIKTRSFTLRELESFVLLHAVKSTSCWAISPCNNIISFQINTRDGERNLFGKWNPKLM